MTHGLLKSVQIVVTRDDFVGGRCAVTATESNGADGAASSTFGCGISCDAPFW
jgi:hypothetical protein